MRRAFVIAGLLLLAEPAWADFESDKGVCARPPTPLAGTAACSRFLQSGRLGALDLAVISLLTNQSCVTGLMNGGAKNEKTNN